MAAYPQIPQAETCPPEVQDCLAFSLICTVIENISNCLAEKKKRKKRENIKNIIFFLKISITFSTPHLFNAV